MQHGEDISGDIGMTIGVFDGIHLGHQKLIGEITETGETLVPVVVTFRENPLAILSPAAFDGNILSAEQKYEKLKLFAIQFVVMIDFSRNFSKMTGREFWLLLNQRLNVKRVVVGSDFRFGSGRAFTAESLPGLAGSTDIRVIEPVTCKGEPISSTRIRKCIRDGEFDDARRMLGDDYKLDMRTLRPVFRNDGTFEIERGTVKQIVPNDGKYKVVFDTDAGNTAGTVTIRGNDLGFATPEKSEYTRMISVRFIERVT